MRAFFPSTSDLTPWPAAFLSLLPLILAGPGYLLLTFQPGWTPDRFPWVYSLYLILSALLIAGGMALGAARQFPRWSYPYPVALAFSLYLLATNAVSQLHLPVPGQFTAFLFLADILICLALPGLRVFYRRVSRDWTLLTYGFYSIVLYLLSLVDHDETPSLRHWVALPSILALGAALAHLRIHSAWARVAVLLAGMVVGLLAPWLVTRAIASWQASRAARA